MELLENRCLLASDFGDAPAPYPTRLEDGGAEHVIGSGLTLGTLVDADLDGAPSPAADGDGADDDGAVFGAIRVGALDASVVVRVAGGSGKLNAWIDFNRDGV